MSQISLSPPFLTLHAQQQAQRRGVRLKDALLAATLGHRSRVRGGRFLRQFRATEVAMIGDLDLAQCSALDRLRGLSVITDESIGRVAVVTVLGK